MRPTSAPEAPWQSEGGLFVEPRLKALGSRHGVTTRPLGDMSEPACRLRALEAAGLGGRSLSLARQEHGTAVVEASAGREEAPAADGLVCADRSAVCGVFVADCLPLFVWDKHGEAAGAFHCGWRGAAAGMPRAAARSFRRYGIGPERLAAAIGPHIGACCCRVGPEVAGKFRPEVLDEGFLDLGEEARLQLLESGLAAGDVSVSGACTSCRCGEFFSYRREKLGSRMLAFIALPPEPG